MLGADEAVRRIGTPMTAIVIHSLKLLAKPERMAWQFDYRIDWDTPVSGALDQLARPA